MDTIYDTLTQAYRICETVKKPYPAEVSMILAMLVSPERIEAFADPDLYLKYIRTLIDYRENVSFPDAAEAYDQYFKDCLMLKSQMAGDAFQDQNWLSACVHLLENLKTPYYPVYSEVLFCLREAFPDTPLFEQTLQAFYSILIRASEETLSIIRLIADHGRHCHAQGWLKDRLLADLMVHHLSIYADGKDLWVGSLSGLLGIDQWRRKEDLLLSWFQSENRFLSSCIDSADIPDTLADLLSAMSRWIRRQDQADFLADFDPGDTTSGSQSRKRWITADKKDPAESSFLNTYAYNMNRRTYITNPAIGREQELKDLQLILISPKKSPILTGESGVGKTSIVEGLAWLLQRGEVPDLLKDKTIFKLTTTSLLGGTKYVGEMEERIRQLTDELTKYPDVILFIDEIHTIVGAGSTESSHNDISNMLKPFIDRGDIKIIGATTTQEYEAYMLPDRALARRFYPIGIEEPDEALTLKILTGTIPSIEQETKVTNPFDEEKTRALLTTLIRLSDRKNQPENRITHLPELPLSILEMAFSYAALYSRDELSVTDLIRAVEHTNLLKKDIRMHAQDYWQNNEFQLT